jgi:hypothetical protein
MHGTGECNMKEFIEKLIGRLEEYPTYSFGVSLLNTEEYIKVSDLKKLVNQLAEEYNNGWIPVEQRLPEQKNVRVDDLEFRTSEFLWVTTNDGEVIQATYETDKWYSYEGILINKNVIAWQPLYVPQPYILKE